MNDIIAWTPNLTEDNGQNIVTRSVIKYIKVSKAFEYPSKSMGPVFWWIYLSNYAKLILTQKSVVYLVISRSKLGFIRDLPVLLCQYFNKEIIVHCHGSDVLELFNRSVLGQIASYLFRDLCFIVPSKHLIDDLKSQGLKKVVVIENFQSNYVSSCYSTVDKDRIITILWNSNIIRSKGIFKLCKMMKLLDDKFALKIYGKIIPEQGERIDELREELKLYLDDKRITYHGSVSPEILEAELKYCDIVMLPSTYKSECQPLAVISAMCAGRRIVLEDTPALRATAGDYPVKYVRNSTAEKLCTAMYEVLDFDEVVIANASLLSNKRYSKNLFEKKIIKCFDGNR